MASFDIHLAIAILYAKKNFIKNKEQFFSGIVEPDLAKDKTKTHYTGYTKEDDLDRHLKEKVNLKLYLQSNSNLLKDEIDLDYQKGIFLHLITDYYFYNDFFDKDYIQNTTYQTFVKDLYYSYNLTNTYLEEKYSILLNIPKSIEQRMNKDIKKVLNSKKVDNTVGTNILLYEKLDKFIERISDINLEEYKNKIINAGENVLI